MKKNIEIIKQALDTTESTDAFVDAIDSLNEIEKQLEENQKQIENKDLYHQADLQNLLRKNKLDLDNAKFKILNKYTLEILPHIDNIKQCLDFAKDNQNLKIGLEMVIQNFDRSLENMGIQKVDNTIAFDPQFHEAISLESNPDVENDSIVNVLQQGYHIAGKVIRPSKVIVNKS